MTTDIDIGLVNMTVDAWPPVLVVRPSRVHCGTEPVDELGAAFWEHEVLAHMVGAGSDLELLELVLNVAPQSSTPLADHSVRATG